MTDLVRTIPRGSWVVFEIDQNDLYGTSSFLKHMNSLNALQKIKGCILAIGSYKGKLNRAYIMSLEDYKRDVVPLGYTKGQESVFVVTEGYRDVLYARLMNPSLTDNLEHLGPLRTSKEPPEADGWTYRPDTQTYYFT